MTYAELHRRSDRLASGLKDLGVNPGDRVGILINKSIESIVVIFGILKTGASYVPIDSLAPRSRVEYILDRCEIRVLITTPEGAGKILPRSGANPSLKIILLPADELFGGRSAPFDPIDFSDTNPAYILHTSGSTGMPKGVGLSHLNALTFVDMAAEYFHVEKEDRLACHAPLQFDLTVFDLFVAVRNGATIVLVPETLSIFPMKLAQFIDEAKITVWNSVASVLSLLAERGRMDRFRFDSLRTVIFSGDVLPAKHLRKLKTLLPRVRFFNVYGQTEANSSMCYPIGEVPEGDAWRMPIGKAFPNFEVFALNELRQVVRRRGEIGELYVRGSSVATGYWGEPEKTSGSFVTDPKSMLSNRKVYRTGDLVTMDRSGDYLFLGREDHQVKCRGYRVQLDEIETVLNNHPSVKEAVVLALPDDLIGNRILAHIATVDGVKLTEMEVFDHCSKTLPGYMVPEKCIFHDHFPKTATGKTDRNSLKESTGKERI
jgi:amino acid adenylation domain-containing protein